MGFAQSALECGGRWTGEHFSGQSHDKMSFLSALRGLVCHLCIVCCRLATPALRGGFLYPGDASNRNQLRSQYCLKEWEVTLCCFGQVGVE